jgi:hypothetical protein
LKLERNKKEDKHVREEKEWIRRLERGEERRRKWKMKTRVK